MSKKNRFSEWLKATSSKSWIIFIAIASVGIGLIVTATLFSKHNITHDVLRDLGIALVPIGIMSLVYESVLRADFLKSMKERMLQAIEDRLPASVKDVRNSGIIGASSHLDIEKLKDHLENRNHTDIKILDIWFENLTHIDDILLEIARTQKCVIRILLWDLKNYDVLIRRAMSIGKGRDEIFIMQSILDNLHCLGHLLDLVEKNKSQYAGTIEVKLYQGFIGISLVGYDNDFYAGFYLRNKFSSMGTQLKVSGEYRFFYKQLHEHFEMQWEDPTNTPYTPELYLGYKAFVDNYIVEKAEARK